MTTNATLATLTEARGSIYCLTSQDPGNTNTGTGFAIEPPEGTKGPLVVTCQHVVEQLGGVQNVSVHGHTDARTWQGSQNVAGHDIAFLEVPSLPSARPFRVESRTPRIRSSCHVFGYRWLDRRLLIGEYVDGTIEKLPRYYSRQAQSPVDGIKFAAKGKESRLYPGFSGAPILVADDNLGLTTTGVFTHAENEDGLVGFAIELGFAFRATVYDGSDGPIGGRHAGRRPRPNPDAALPAVTNPIDPNKGRFGGSSRNKAAGLELRVNFHGETTKDVFWFDVSVKVEHLKPSEKVGPFRFHLYPDYVQPIITTYKIHDDGCARLEGVSSTGVYTLGVQVFRRGKWIPLEYDLAATPWARGHRRFLSR